MFQKPYQKAYEKMRKGIERIQRLEAKEHDDKDLKHEHMGHRHVHKHVVPPKYKNTKKEI